MVLYNSKRIDINNDLSLSFNKIETMLDVPFSKLTTYGCGGRARAVLCPHNLLQAKVAYDIASKQNMTIIGNGSNVLAQDGYYDGFILSTKKIKGIFRCSNDVIFCACGTSVAELMNYCKINALSGLEYLAGIPATVGGLTFMNGGIVDCHIQNSVISVLLYDEKIRIISNEKCCFGYKYSTMRDIKSIILGVWLRVSQNKTSVVEDNINTFLFCRENLPRGKSCGCVFKNVNGVSSGKIIQDCGLCGTRIGSAYVSEKHANFIVSDGNDSVSVKTLIDKVKRTVKDKFGIVLEEEVVYIGEFNDFNG